MKMWRRHSKIVAWMAIFTFMLCNTAWTEGEAFVWSYAKPDIRLNGRITLNGIKVPYEAGTPQEAFSNGGDEAVVNIQDAHASLSAQKSIDLQH